MDILYYSNYCKHSQKLIQMLVKNNLTDKISCICIDKRIQDKQTGQTYICLENGSKIIFPPNIQSVPSLLLINNQYKIITGDEIIIYFHPQIKQQNNNATNYNGEPMGYYLEASTGGTNILSEKYTDYNMTHDDIAKYTGKSRSHITNILRLNDLVDYVKTKLQDGSIEMGHARAVLSLDSSLQETIIKNAVIKRLSVRAVEALARNSRVKNVKKSNDINQDTVALEKDLSEHLAADIKISHKSNGTGKLEIKYKSLNELQGIVAKFKK